VRIRIKRQSFFSFGEEELKQLLISALVITFVFVYDSLVGPYSLLSKLEVFAVYFLFVGVSFMVHESAHKFTAKSLGAWSEFRMWLQGLGFAVLMRIIGGPIFIAPGATLWVKPFATQEDGGKVSVAGPASNLVLALLFFGASLFLPFMKIGTQINLSLALFNLFPFPPLDGYAIVKWKPAVWIILFVITMGSRFFV
jgi:Zn-dependent protease